MPTYQYACTECSHAFEQFQSFTDDALTECPECGGRLRKLFNAVGVVFKGSGFYRTDSRAAPASESDVRARVLGLRRAPPARHQDRDKPAPAASSTPELRLSDRQHRAAARTASTSRPARAARPTGPVDDRPGAVPISPTVTGCSVTA